MWTLFDYLGEPSGGWPHVISSFVSHGLHCAVSCGAHVCLPSVLSAALFLADLTARALISPQGQFDLAGFPKAQAHWYRNQWLLRSHDSQANKPFSTASESRVHLVESWERPQKMQARPAVIKRLGLYRARS